MTISISIDAKLNLTLSGLAKWNKFFQGKKDCSKIVNTSH